MPSIYTFFEITIITTAVLTIILFLASMMNNGKILTSIIIAIIPIAMLGVGHILNSYGSPFYIDSISAFQFNLVIIYPLLIIALMHLVTVRDDPVLKHLREFCETRTVTHELFTELEDIKLTAIKSKIGIYSISSIVLFFFVVVIHPLPSEYTWDDRVSREHVRQTLKYRIPCTDKISKWLYKKKIDREAILDIDITRDKNQNIILIGERQHIFDPDCNYLKTKNL